VESVTLYTLKPRFQALLRPSVRWLADRGATANQVTIVAALGSITVAVIVAVAIAAGTQHRIALLLVPLWLFVRMALNAVDGMLAREFSQKSRLGAYLNELGDVVSDAALYAPFALVAPFGPFGVAAVIVLAGLSELAGVLGPTIGASRRYDGPLGKSDRALVFGALGAWIGIGLPLANWLAWLMPLIAVLLIVTSVNRVRAGLAESIKGERHVSQQD
jgi:CDP-diacylglycerol---glycerol-3-phosphate 3-phosphatidyltransferase